MCGPNNSAHLLQPDHNFKVMQRTALTANCCFETSIVLFCLFTLPRYTDYAL